MTFLEKEINSFDVVVIVDLKKIFQSNNIKRVDERLRHFLKR